MLIPRFGFIGATYTSITVNILLTILLWPQSQKVLPVNIPSSWILRWAAFSLLLGAVLFLGSPFLTSILRTILGLALMGIIMGSFLMGLGYRQMLLKSPS
jgi:hypothetical protein